MGTALFQAQARLMIGESRILIDLADITRYHHKKFY
jgi:hypothetical protein